MVPVLIRFVLLVPGFPGNGRAALYHVTPTAIVRCGDQGQRGRVLAVFEQALQQILCGVDRSRHAATGEPLRELRPLSSARHEPKGQGKQVGMQRRMVGSDSIAIESTRPDQRAFPGRSSAPFSPVPENLAASFSLPRALASSLISCKARRWKALTTVLTLVKT